METPTGTARAENPARKRFVLSEEVEAVPVESVVILHSDTNYSSTNRIIRSLSKEYKY